MKANNRLTPGRVLVASDSNIARDPRVLKQIRWLVELGWVVDTLGRGDQAESVNGTHFAMPRRSIVTRVLSYFFLPNRAKYRVLIESTIPSSLRTGIGEPRYGLAVLNEIELLPWFVPLRHQLLGEGAQAHLDLHEYAPSQRAGLLYWLVFRRFRAWLIEYIPSPAFDSRSVVATGIARLYAELFGIAEPAVIRNAPAFVDQIPTVVDANNIRLVHHGVASASRSLDLLIDAVSLAGAHVSLELMLVGPPAALDPYRHRASRSRAGITFREPVAVHEIAKALNEYDLEVIFYPPKSENLRFSLPNKFFEAIQGRIGVVVGESPEMAAIVKKYGNGLVVPGWSTADLAAGLRSLTAESVTAMKASSNSAAADLSAESEQKRFVTALGL